MKKTFYSKVLSMKFFSSKICEDDHWISCSQTEPREAETVACGWGCSKEQSLQIKLEMGFLEVFDPSEGRCKGATVLRKVLGQRQLFRDESGVTPMEVTVVKHQIGPKNGNVGADQSSPKAMSLFLFPKLSWVWKWGFFLRWLLLNICLNSV